MHITHILINTVLYTKGIEPEIIGEALRSRTLADRQNTLLVRMDDSLGINNRFRMTKTHALLAHGLHVRQGRQEMVVKVESPKKALPAAMSRTRGIRVVQTPRLEFLGQR